MQIKTYKGYSNYEILQKIKVEMGDDAIILNSRTEEVNGKKLYIVMAAKDTKSNNIKTMEEEKSQRPEDIWYREWVEFKEQIFSLIKDSIDIPSLSSRQKAAIRHLEREGVGQDFIMSLICMLKRNGRSFMEILNSLIKVDPFYDISDNRLCHVMVGPHGVGKTSIILKLALNYKRQNPDSRICLVNVDNYQGKGKLFLKHYSELSNFQYKELRELRDGATLMAEMGKFDRIYIDTPGLKHGMDLDTWWDNSPLNLLENLKVHLVLSPLFSREQIDHYLSRYLSDRLSSIMWTKLDEACIFGTMLYTCFKTQLPISLFNCGPQLKDPIQPVTRNALWNVIFKHKIPGKYN